MRLNLKFLMSIALGCVLLLSVTFWSKCSDANKHDSHLPRDSNDDFYDGDELSSNEQGAKVPSARLQEVGPHGNPTTYEEIDCIINEDYTVIGRREGDEVYIPFSFISKYFEIYGKIEEYDGYERFEWQHSYSKVYTPKGKYTPQGIFMSFEHYNVEVRDRVKCISGIEGVPISTQWGAHGYYYPIQIAQYGLSHYSKYLVENPPKVTMLDDAEYGDTSNWSAAGEKASIDNVVDPDSGNRVIQFKTSDDLDNPGITLRVGKTQTFFLSLDIMFKSNGSITVVVEPKGKRPKPYYIHYVGSKTSVSIEGKDIYYGIGDRSDWTHITRDLATDFQKGLAQRTSKKSSPKLVINKVVSVNLRGRGYVDNITLATTSHLSQFYYAANWLVNHQDEKGGWPIMVTRKLANGFLQLPPGWYSAMAQGQAMSLLTRAYHRTKNRQYLDAALKATKIFDIPSAEGGVLTQFMDKYDWYEEYPTSPSCFVLNGFIYSLIGLYDLKSIAPKAEVHHAETLYKAGMASLKAMLPFFDTGSGSIYDLRHYSLGVAPNLARWDYHATHINQLLLLSTIDQHQIFKSTASRWMTYMKGKRAPHN